jgi:hypothetical protein
VIASSGKTTRAIAHRVTCHTFIGMVHPGISHISAGLKCQLCGSPKRAATMVIRNVCSTGWHLECLTPPLLEVPIGQWSCPVCVRR